MRVSKINWQEIDTVLLDLDGTLLDLHFDNYFWLDHLPMRWAQVNGRSESECRTYLHGLFQDMRGTLNWYCLDYWSEKLQMDMVELKKEVIDKIQLRPYAISFLEYLGDIGKQKILVTNGHPDGMKLKFFHTCIESHFDQVVSCHRFQAPKEEQSFWRQFQGLHPFDKNRTLFIDDNESVLVSAERYGIKHLLQILQPDMQQPSRPIGNFPAIEHFSEILD